MSDAPRPNTPVPDELAAVREQIKALELREEELRRLLIVNPELRTGAAWLAEIRTTPQQRTDLKEMRANHPEIVDEFTYATDVTRVVLSGISEDGEIVSARRMRNARRSS